MKREKYIGDVPTMIAQWQRNASHSSDQSAEAKDWRRRLTRIAAEARERELAKDWDWFWWLDEYARMRAQTIFEDFQKYDGAITAGAQTMRQRRSASLKGGGARSESAKSLRAEIIKTAARLARRIAARNIASAVAQQLKTTTAKHVREVLAEEKRTKPSA